MSNTSSDSNFMKTFNSMAYEQLTGHKPSASIMAASAQHQDTAAPSAKKSSSTVASNSAPSGNGTGHWAAGMANAGEVLGNLGMSSDLAGSESSTWDIPPHSTYNSSHNELLHSNKVSLVFYVTHKFVLQEIVIIYNRQIYVNICF